MNTTHYKRGLQNRYPHRQHLLTVLLIAAMVMISTVPAFASETTVDTSAPGTEVSASTPDSVESPADEAGAPEVTPAQTTGPVSTIGELIDAIAHAKENDVIEIDSYIQMRSSELVLGRADCPITIRRATSEAYIYLWNQGEGNIKVQNITFDGAGIQAQYPILDIEGPTKIIEKCNFVNCIAAGSSVLKVGSGDTFISDCHFTNNTGFMGAHLRINSHNTTIENCTFTGGFASDIGSIYIGAAEKTVFRRCTISGNAAGKRSGGIYIQDGEVIILGCKIYGNTVNGVADDITKSYRSLLSLMDDYSALVELYKPDGVIPNRWTVDSYFDLYSGMGLYQADMIFSMTFADNEPSLPPSPTSITLDKSELTLDIGETGTLTATLYPEGTNSSVQWTSSDPSVASVTENGLIIAHSTGKTSITATEAVGEASASCLVTVQEAPATTYSVSLSASPTEGGTVSGDGQYEEGVTATVTAVPNEKFSFLAWTEAGTQISTEASLSFTVTSDRTLTAIFEPTSESAPGPIPKPTYTINTSATIGGTVSGGGEYEQGSSVTLTAIPNSGYLFVGWTENDEQISVDESITFVVDRGRTLVANFTPVPKPIYTIHVNSTQGGVTEGGGSYEEGEFITVNAVPDAGYRFLCWEENGIQVSTEVRYSFTSEANRTLIAVFELTPQSVPNSTYDPPHNPGTPSISSLSSKETPQIPALTNGKAVLTAPDDLFWRGYKTGRDNSTRAVTRADLAQLVYFMMDANSRKVYGVTQSSFRDVESGTWYEAAVGTMLNTGIMVGCGDNLFCPDHTLTWGELLTVFARFTADKQLTEYYTGEHWARNAVNKAFTLGWLEYSDTFDPRSIVTTSEMVDLIQAVFRWSNE